jgi:hypothetical protein
MVDMNHNSSNHDLLIRLEERLNYICDMVEELRNGQAPMCMRHKQQLVEINARVNMLWGIMATIVISIIVFVIKS